jgi:hypothetical protein
MSRFLYPVKRRRRLYSCHNVGLIAFILSFIALYRLRSVASPPSASRPIKPSSPLSPAGHPIDDLIHAAHVTFSKLVSKRTYTLADAAAAYRRRRGRHPPPAFKLWYKFAEGRNAVMVEDFFDAIYHDLEPFWAVDPAKMRMEADEFEMVIHVRNGRATSGSDWFWTRIWLDMLRTIEHLLPDMDIALNAMDEPRIIVPWGHMAELRALALKTMKIVNPESTVTGFQNLPPPTTGVKQRRKFRRDGTCMSLPMIANSG